MWCRLSVSLAALLLLADGHLSSAAAGPEKVGLAYPVDEISLDGDLSDGAGTRISPIAGCHLYPPYLFPFGVAWLNNHFAS